LRKIVALLLFTAIVFSCNNEVKSITFKTEEITQKSESKIKVLLSKAKGNSEVEKAINLKVEDAIVKSISLETKDKKSLKEALSTFENEYQKFIRDFPEGSAPWILNVESEVIYQSEEIITISLNIYIDKGGAHGNDNIQFLNFNPSNGNLYTQNDIIKNRDDFGGLAETYFNRSIKSEASDNPLTEDYFFGEAFQLPKNIGFSNDGLILLYNVYEIASHAQGYTEFAIPFNVAEPYLKVN